MEPESAALTDHTRTGSGVAAEDELPPLAGLFVSYFDTKAGYTIAWKQTTSDVQLESIEFKALPSGLHNVKEDLVYFVSGGYAGVSAFMNHSSTLEERGALMLSIGALVPLSYGRLGRCWKHAKNLKNLASQIGPCRNFGIDTTAHQLLEGYFHKHRVAPSPSTQPTTTIQHSPLDSPSSLRFRPTAGRGYRLPLPMEGMPLHHTPSWGSAKITAQPASLSPYHPALSLVDMIDTFGPLVFPLYRAALTRKRILLMTQAPVEVACNYVYDISILSTIPTSVAHLRGITEDAMRLHSLFSIGLHDIPHLERQALNLRNNPDVLNPSWVACTTETIISTKTTLYDMLITLPPAHTKQANRKIWPRVEWANGKEVKATQRDLRRYRDLRAELEEFGGGVLTGGEAGERSKMMKMERRVTPREEEEVCEKATWAELAYSGFLWWASAGEKRGGGANGGGSELMASWKREWLFPWEERNRSRIQLGGNEVGNSDTPDAEENDVGRVAEGVPPTPHPVEFMQHPEERNGAGEGVEGMEMFIIAYFHRLTAKIMNGLVSAVDAWGDYEAGITASASISSSEENTQDDNNAEDDDDDDQRVLLRTRGESGSGGTKMWVSREEMARMGLDMWSANDERFVQEMGRRWWGADVVVDGKGVCGCC